MGWQLVVALNVVIVGCYAGISGTILLGLRSTRQLLSNKLAVATAVIFLTCALHHGHHALHLLVVDGPPGQTEALREAFGTVHGVSVDAFGALVALGYLALRRSYGTLLNTPAMFEDQVRLATERRLRELAYVDPLTGCGNRAAYEQQVDAVAGSDVDVVLAFLDLDDFKAVNDTHGHEVGDRVLREIGGRLSAAMQDGEQVFRLGGDEFVVAQVGLGEAAANGLLARCEAIVGEPVAVREGQVQCRASGGLARGLASRGLQNVLREADAEMYLVKNGRYADRAVPRPRPRSTC